MGVIMLKRWAILAASLFISVANVPAPVIKSAPLKVLPAAATSRQSETPPDRGCVGKPSDRSSELCAQWSAVDVASVALKWSEASFWLGILGTFLGLLTTAAAFLAARYAKGAFQAAELDLRPWMQFDIQQGWTSGQADGYTVAIVIIAKNIGRTPAIDISCLSKTHRWDAWAKDKHIMPFFKDNVFEDANTELVSLLPGEEYRFQVLSSVPNDDTKRIPTIAIKLGYRWPNGTRARTCRAYHSIYTWAEAPIVHPETGSLRWESTDQRLWVAPVNLTD